MEATGSIEAQDDTQVSPSGNSISTPGPCILGVDPGLTGALAFFFPDVPGRVLVEDMPVVGGEVDPHGLARIIRRMGPARAMIEQVSAMPKNGSIAGFKLGMAYGVVRGAIAIAGVPLQLVPPTAWKKHFRLKGGEVGKEAGRALAIQRFPTCADQFGRKKDHNRADAALIALYATEAAR